MFFLPQILASEPLDFSAYLPLTLKDRSANAIRTPYQKKKSTLGRKTETGLVFTLKCFEMYVESGVVRCGILRKVKIA